MTGAPFTPMLATAGELPHGPAWGYELKWDGIRALAVCRRGRVRLFARRGNEVTVAYPELVSLGGVVDDAIFDGEVVVLDPAGRPSFVQLAERMHVRDEGRAARLAAQRPVTYMIFDLLRLDGVDLLEVPYLERRRLLEELPLAGGAWLVPPSFSDGSATRAASVENGLEGVVAKRLAAPYRPGVRSPDWIKVKAVRTGDFVVGGWRPGARAVGALLVGVPAADGQLAYRGRVGGGISAAAERELTAALRPLVTEGSPFGNTIPREDSRTAVWVRPEIVVEVKFGERTPDRRLRFPRYVRLRPDLLPGEVSDD